MDVLSSRILLRLSDWYRSSPFYRDMLGLAIYREFGLPDDPGVVFVGSGFLEVSGHAAGRAGRLVVIWIQVRDVCAEHAWLAATGVPVIGRPQLSLGTDRDADRGPDSIRIVLVEVPADRPLCRDPRCPHGARPRRRGPGRRCRPEPCVFTGLMSGSWPVPGATR